KEMVKEIVAKDKLIDAYELKINKDCENILALHTPVAIDLRFVLASIKINSNLERIGDHAVGIAKLLVDFEDEFEKNLLDNFKVSEMYAEAIAMVDSIIVALANNDTSLAREIFKKDDFLNDNYKKAAKNAIKILQAEPQKAEAIINLLSIIRKIERVGDLTKNLGMEIIFHIEAKVLRHAKKGKKT
ncbi:MAG TPA: phosphate signaling complex protein PhoU, partial [Cytophagales bacterium]|nr:phosphate signaling complex protein PhoU [Cytophagales bacterium]